ncbi:MAG TPA: hypothetical protein EYQ70_02160 [Marine Group III euryarchaeote]|uniref:Uncharacterized protein n=1 Tax=Marine Group III euryarchaeote TaxID=2173149 RepID=A0A7J4GUM5_9ARCH|nr:hypothetical protein [Marine Group III euryarchaeote]
MIKNTRIDKACPYIVLNSIELLKLSGRISPKKSWKRKATEVKAIVKASVNTNVVKNQCKTVSNSLEKYITRAKRLYLVCP